MSYFQEVINKALVLQRLIDGKVFFAHRQVSVTTGNTDEVLIKVGTTALIMFATVSSDDKEIVDFYEGPTISADGTAVSVYNANRGSANTEDFNVYHTPTTSADGTLLEEEITPTAGDAVVGPGTSEGVPWILAPNTNYLMRFTNDGGASATALYALSFVELT